MQYLALDAAIAMAVDCLDPQIALRDGIAGTVAVDAHRADMHHMDVPATLDDGAEQIVGSHDVVVDGIALVPRRLHGVGRGFLLGEMDYRLRLETVQKLNQPFII